MVTAVLPAQGPTTGVIVVLVRGSHLTSGDSCNYADLSLCPTTSVDFGTSAATVLYASPTDVYVEAPAAAETGPVDVTVTVGPETSA
ncbi:MAG: IPT/TIG domain-containing protein, partial [Acidimicrobiales bacterium]